MRRRSSSRKLDVKDRLKRAGQRQRESRASVAPPVVEPDIDLLALNDALDELTGRESEMCS